MYKREIKLCLFSRQSLVFKSIYLSFSDSITGLFHFNVLFKIELKNISIILVLYVSITSWYTKKIGCEMRYIKEKFEFNSVKQDCKVILQNANFV